MLHANAAGAITAHGMAGQAAARAVGNSAVMSVDIGDHIVGDKLFKVASGDGTGIHRTVVQGLGVGQHHNHLLGALGEGALDGLGHMDFLGPLLGADGEAVQCIDHRIAAALATGIAGRQEDNDVAVDGIAFQIAFQCGAVNLDVLHRHGLGAGHWQRYLCLDLPHNRAAAKQSKCQRYCQYAESLPYHSQTLHGFFPFNDNAQLLSPAELAGPHGLR